jgi:transposase
MEKIPHGNYTKEFGEEAVRLVTEQGMSSGEASLRLGLPKSTLENWGRAVKVRKLDDVGNNRRPLTEVELELARIRRELAITRMERDILKLKKAAAYFEVSQARLPAKESLHGTR